MFDMPGPQVAAFAHGSNDVANGIGPLAAVVSLVNSGGEVAQKADLPLWILVLGGVGIVAGLTTLGYRVMRTIGSEITHLTPTRGYCETLAAATTVVLASKTGLPVSTTHIAVGAVMGVGMTSGVAAVDLRVIRDIVASWLITLPAGIALAFGANIGTCVTALLATIGKPREAMRAALVHVFFNVFGVLVWLAFIGQLAELVTWMSPAHTELTGMQRLAAEAPRQIANAHTVFNIANTLIFIGFTGQFARLVEWLVPDKPLEEKVIAKPRYLDDALLERALDRTRFAWASMSSRAGAALNSRRDPIS